MLYCILTLTILGVQVSMIKSQAIPYSYASGRDVAAVEARYSRFRAAKAANAGPDVLIGICGKVDPNAKCTTKIGRPKDSESLACDSLCCLAGHKVGNCGSSYGFKLDFAKIISSLGGSGNSGSSGSSSGSGAIAAIAEGLTQGIAANCYCSDDPIDVRCGRDGSVLGIHCPDNSSCWRKCCRQGKSGGHCKGLFKLKCKCD